MALRISTLGFMEEAVSTYDDGGFNGQEHLVKWVVDFPDFWCVENESVRGRRKTNSVKLQSGSTVEDVARRIMEILKHFESGISELPPVQ